MSVVPAGEQGARHGGGGDRIGAGRIICAGETVGESGLEPGGWFENEPGLDTGGIDLAVANEGRVTRIGNQQVVGIISLIDTMIVMGITEPVFVFGAKCDPAPGRSI